MTTAEKFFLSLAILNLALFVRPDFWSNPISFIGLCAGLFSFTLIYSRHG